MSSVEFVKLDETATLPTLDGEKDFVFYSNEVQIIPVNTIRKINSGVALSEESKGAIFRVEEDETVPFDIGPGLYDSGRSGHRQRELCATIVNRTDDDITINKGDKLGKLIRIV